MLCNKTDTPAIPDGSVASFEEMASARQAVVNYVKETERYLNCNIIASMRFNRIVHVVEETADSYNQQLRRFRAVQSVSALAIN